MTLMTLQAFVFRLDGTESVPIKILDPIEIVSTWPLKIQSGLGRVHLVVSTGCASQNMISLL